MSCLKGTQSWCDLELEIARQYHVERESQGHLGVWKGGSLYTELRCHLQGIVGNWDNQLEPSVDSCYTIPSRSADGDHHGEKGGKAGEWNILMRGGVLGLRFRGGRTKVGTETCLVFFSVQKQVAENISTLSLVLVGWNTVNKTKFLARGLPPSPALWTDLYLLSKQRGRELANGTLNRWQFKSLSVWFVLKLHTEH